MDQNDGNASGQSLSRSEQSSEAPVENHVRGGPVMVVAERIAQESDSEDVGESGNEASASEEATKRAPQTQKHHKNQRQAGSDSEKEGHSETRAREAHNNKHANRTDKKKQDRSVDKQDRPKKRESSARTFRESVFLSRLFRKTASVFGCLFRPLKFRVFFSRFRYCNPN